MSKNAYRFGHTYIDEVDDLYIVRDDLHPGGTKARILDIIVSELNNFNEFVYAGHPFGLASIALAYACQNHDKKATFFFPEMDKYPQPYYDTKKFDNVDIHLIAGNLKQQDLLPFAESYTNEGKDRHLFPIGFSTPRFDSLLSEFAKTLPIAPKEVWCIAESGTLARCLKEAWPEAEINAVSLGFPQLNAGSANIYHAQENTDAPAECPPPFPSAEYYDAKAWRFIQQHASKGAIFWNVASPTIEVL